MSIFFLYALRAFCVHTQCAAMTLRLRKAGMMIRRLSLVRITQGTLPYQRADSRVIVQDWETITPFPGPSLRKNVLF
jgi:hypothetical protein